MITSMYDMEVTLINKDEVSSFVKNHGEFACICYNTDTKYAKSVGINVLDSGHLSGSRGDFFKFNVRLVPRACMDQAVRHEVGVYKNCQSLRYVNMHDFAMCYPQEILCDEELLDLWISTQESIQKCYDTTVAKLESKGIEGEKAYEIARGMLPMNIDTEFNFGLNVEGLINFMNKRLCTCSQDIIRLMARRMRIAVLDVASIYEPLLKPICSKLLYCPESEKRSCGKMPIKSKAIEYIMRSCETKDVKEK